LYTDNTQNNVDIEGRLQLSAEDGVIFAAV